MFTNEADAILIEIGRGISQTSFVGLQRNRDAVPAQEPGTPYLYNPKLGMMRYEGLPKSKEKERIGRWYRVTPDWTTFRRMITRDPFSTCMSAKVIGETKRVYCEVSKIVNENQHSFTYYTGAGMILDVTDSFLLIWHDKLGLISHFNKGLEDKFVHMQVVKFKAESKAETRHSAFHAREVKPARECRFRRLLCQSDALVKSYQAEAGKKKILYAQCPNGDRVLLLDADKHLLRKGNELGLNADEKIEVVYYKIYAGEKLVYVSGFYFQTDEEGPAKAFWDSQWERFAKTGTATDEDLPECYAESAPSECDLTDDTYREQWKKHFQFWNPDHEDIDWMSDDFTVKPFVLGRTSVTNSEVSNLTHSTATRLSISRNPAITPSPVTVSSISTTAYVEEETVQERTEKKQDRPPKVENPFDFLVQPPEKQPVEKKKPRLATPKEKDPLEIAETVEFEEDLEEKEPVQMEPERHPFNFVRKKLWQKMSEETRTALMKKAISEAKAQTWKRMAEAEVCILRGRSDSVQFSDVSQASNCSNTSVTNSAGPSSRSSSTVPEPAEKLLELPKTVSLPKTGPLPSISPVLDGDSFNKHPKSLRLTAKNPSESIEAYLKRQMTIIDTDDSISVRNVLNKIVSTDRIMKMIAKDDPALNAILLQMYLYPDYVYIGHLALLDERYSQRESSGTAHLDRLNMERDILQYICNSTAIWEEISRIAPYCLSTIGPIQMYIFVD